MPVATFSPSQPWGSAEAHQREHPTAWTAELAEATAAWTDVVRAIVQGQEDLVQNVSSSFVRRCAEDAGLRSHLDLLVERGLHGLLVAWVIEGIRERLATHAVPAFWRYYHGVAGSGERSWKLSAGMQRSFQAAFFAAVHELNRYVSAQLHLVALVDGRQWHSAALQCAGTPRCREVTEMVQAFVLAQAPEAHTFAAWLTVCWQRSFADASRGVSAAAPAGGSEGGDDVEGEEEGEEEAFEDGGGEEGGEGEDVSDMLVEDGTAGGGAAEPLRACCAELHALDWLPLVEPTLSAMLHQVRNLSTSPSLHLPASPSLHDPSHPLFCVFPLAPMLHQRLHALLLRRCAKRFDERMLKPVLAWLRKGVSRWLRNVLMPVDPSDAPPSPALQQWLARLRFFLMQALATLRISELFDMIVDYPDSLPALADLKECLSHTHQHQDAVHVLADAIEARLLKPGTKTTDIIQVRPPRGPVAPRGAVDPWPVRRGPVAPLWPRRPLVVAPPLAHSGEPRRGRVGLSPHIVGRYVAQVYVAAIKALRQLDPTGVTLEGVSDRVRTYLKARSDTIRQIVTSLTDPETSELLEAGVGAEGEPELLKDDGGMDGEVRPSARPPRLRAPDRPRPLPSNLPSFDGAPF